MKHSIKEGLGWKALLGNPDSLAVIGARTSRRLDVGARYQEMIDLAGTDEWDPQQAPSDVVTFLRKNLGEYGHGSIADMATVTVVLEKVPHYLAWFLVDSPLFKGQETSTRAVSSWEMADERYLGWGPTNQLPEPGVVDNWLRLHAAIGAGAPPVSSKNYPHDLTRFFVPSFCGTTVTLHGTVYDLTKTVDGLAYASLEYPGARVLAESLIEGIEAVAPLVADCLGLRERLSAAKAHGGFSSTLVKGYVTPHGVPNPSAFHMGPRSYPQAWGAWSEWKRGVVVVPEDMPEDMLASISLELSSGSKQHMPAGLHNLPRPDLFLWGSLAAARDWHRHRRLFPLKVVIGVEEMGPGGHFCWSYAATGAAQLLSSRMNDREAQVFKSWMRAVQDESSSHPGFIPLGAHCLLTSRPTWPSLAYALLLRSSAQGAHAEYKTQALDAIGSIQGATHNKHLRSKRS